MFLFPLLSLYLKCIYGVLWLGDRNGVCRVKKFNSNNPKDILWEILPHPVWSWKYGPVKYNPRVCISYYLNHKMAYNSMLQGPCPCSLLSLRSFPTCRQLQPPTSSFIIIVVTDLTNTTHYSRRPCLSGGRKLSLEQSATRCYISSDSRCFQNPLETYLFSCSFTHWLTLIHHLMV